jgi:hypothetical protein
LVHVKQLNNKAMSTTTNTVSFNKPFEVMYEGIVYGGQVWGEVEVDYEGNDIDEPMLQVGSRLVSFEVEDVHDSDGEEVNEDVYLHAEWFIETNFENFI